MSVPTRELPAAHVGLEGEPDTVPLETSPRTTSGLLRALVRWGFVVAAIVFMVRTIVQGWPEITQAVGALSSKDAALLALVVLIESLWVLTLAQVYKSSLIAFGGEARHRDALRVSMGAFTLSRVLPGGGAVGALLAAREFVRVGNGGPLTLVALVTAGWISLVTLTTALTVGVGIGVAWGGLSWGLLAPPLVILAVLAVAPGRWEGWLCDRPGGAGGCSASSSVSSPVGLRT